MATQRRQGRRTLVGWLLILGLAALATAVLFLDQLTAALRDTYELVVVLPSGSGLRPGDDVWVAGVNAGTIGSIAVLAPGRDTTPRVAAVVAVRTGVRSQIRRDSKVRLTSEKLVGPALIEIVPGSPGSPVLQPGDTLRLQQNLAPAELMKRAAAVRSSLDSLLAEAAPLRGRLARSLGRYARVAGRAGAARRDMAALMGGLRGGPLQRFLADTTRAELGRTLRAVERKVSEAQARATRFETSSAPERRRLRQDLARVSVRLDSVRAMLGDSLGTLHRLRADSALIHAMATTRASLDSLITESKKNPLRYFF